MVTHPQKSTSSNAIICNGDNQAKTSTMTTATPSASSSLNVRSVGGSGNMQQLSTSWEFIKLEHRPILDLKTDDEKDEPQDVAPPRFIKISDGKISLGPPKPCENTKDKEVMEARIMELEEALLRLQEKVNNSQCGSPTLERDLKEQLENMSRSMRTKDRRAMQACRDYKVLQARFSRQENLLHIMQQENKTLQQRIRQYEHCLDDVMRKVVDAIVAEDSLREEVSMLKTRVRDLEAQNAALSASPAKGKDEGYCTMSSGQPQPSNSHLEDLPEEPEQWLMSAEPCSADMEDWSMSQEELGIIPLDDESNDHEHDWIWNSSGYLNSTMIDSQSEGISQLLQETIIYSEDEEIACIDFTRDFYKLVNITSESTRSLHSHMEAETDDEDENCSEYPRVCRNGEVSPTPSEAGRAQVTSCSSSDSGDQSRTDITVSNPNTSTEITCTLRSDLAITNSNENSPSWRKSNGWKRVEKEKEELVQQETVPEKKKSPPEVPVRRSFRQTKSELPPAVPIRRSYRS